MSKEEIIAALQAKFGGIPSDTISGIAEKLAKTADPSATDANTLIEGITFADIVKSYGDSRAQSAAQTAVRNYERKFQLKDGAPITPNTPPQTPADTPQQPTPQHHFKPAAPAASSTAAAPAGHCSPHCTSRGASSFPTARPAKPIQGSATANGKKEQIRSRHQATP